MALIANIEKHEVESPRVHDSLNCTYSVFTSTEGQKYLQLNTFGSPVRQNPGKQSQTMQLNETAAKQLVKILVQEFF